MAEKLVNFEELLRANMTQIDAVTQLLIQKGIITEKEFFTRLKQAQRDYESKRKSKLLGETTEKWNVEITEYYYDQDSPTSYRGTVHFLGNQIRVSYGKGANSVTYIGTEEETKGWKGHYHLRADNVKGEATLHRFANSEILEGYWIEGGYEGFWRIKLLNKIKL